MDVQVIVSGISGRTSCLQLDDCDASPATIARVKSLLSVRDGIPPPLQRLRYPTGRCDLDDAVVVADGQCLVQICVLLGGKGGFGSLLRGASTKVGQKATSNYTACRDLSGRRVRHVADEKALASWQEEQLKSGAPSASSSSNDVRKQYMQIKSDKHERGPCKYGDDCKYKHKGCRFAHSKAPKTPVGLGQQFASSPNAPSSLSFDLNTSIEQGLIRKRKSSPPDDVGSKKFARS